MDSLKRSSMIGSSMIWLLILTPQWCKATKYIYLSTVLKYSFEVFVLYLGNFKFQYFYFYSTTSRIQILCFYSTKCIPSLTSATDPFVIVQDRIISLEWKVDWGNTKMSNDLWKDTSVGTGQAIIYLFTCVDPISNSLLYILKKYVYFFVWRLITL